ncbi:PAS domain S-box protein [Acetobacterium paludosum]|uniref:PAS domain S-box protein n=1 Tax=Acetobacterium paludosum TaxID=52693 RepID=A0A923KXR6_9FIRM|nr:HD domain-containing phosphohydrolase [Acetobacterium paludosum]MBC3889698.1 PAS domain S-box protein [Acetobacterium paludosum]
MKQDIYKKVIENSSIGYVFLRIIYDHATKPVDYEFLDTNAAFEDLINLQSEEILGKSFAEVILNIHLLKYDRHSFYHKLANKNEDLQLELYSEATHKWYNIHADYPESGYIVLLFIDITNKKETVEEKIDLLSSLYEIYFELDRDYRFTKVITNNEELLFIPKNKIIGKLITDIFDKNWSENFILAFQTAFKTEKKQFVEYESRFPNDDRFFLAEINCLKRNHQFIQYTVGISDFSYQKRAERKLNEDKERYKLIFNHVPVGIMQFDTNGKIVNCNEKFAQIIGTDKDNLIGFNASAVKDPIFYNAYISVLNNKTIEVENEYHSLSGNKTTYLRALFEPVIGEKGATIGAIGIVEDISKRKNLEKQIEFEKERFKTTLLSIGDGVIATDIYNRIILMNKAAEKITGWSQEDALEKSSENILNIFDEKSGEKCESPVIRVMKTGEIISMTDHTMLVSRTGKTIPIKDSAAPIKDESDNIIGVVIVFRDITASREKEAEIKYLSFHDHLTGLYNRRFFDIEMQRLNTERNLPLALIVSDVNGLKLTNDAFGHLVGDRLLKTVANTMKQVCRSDEIISRIGGDEFVILLPKTDSARVKQIVKQISDNLASEILEMGSVSISSGWEIKTDMNQDIEEILKSAEKKMYRHKVSERNSTRNDAILFIVKTLYEKFPREQKHAENVGELSEMLGKTVGLTNEEINELITAGNLHDIGKIAISNDILNKNGALSDEDWNEIRRHPEISYSILSTISNYASLANIILYHHERYDGKGYPKGLKGKEIPLQSRIITIADAYDVITSDSSYKKALRGEAAIAELRSGAGSQFDPDLVEAFIKGLLFPNDD